MNEFYWPWYGLLPIHPVQKNAPRLKLIRGGDRITKQFRVQETVVIDVVPKILDLCSPGCSHVNFGGIYFVTPLHVAADPFAKHDPFRCVSKTVSDLIEDAPRKITPDRLPFSNLSSVCNMIIIAARVLEEVNDVSQKKRGFQSRLTGSCVTPGNFWSETSRSSPKRQEVKFSKF